MKSLSEFLSCLVEPQMATSGVKVALVIGSLLMMINHGSAIISGQMTQARWFSALLTYLVPYLVNIHGQYTSQSKRSISDFALKKEYQLAERHERVS